MASAFWKPRYGNHARSQSRAFGRSATGMDRRLHVEPLERRLLLTAEAEYLDEIFAQTSDEQLDLGRNDRFGDAIAYAGDLVVIGAPENDDAARGAGAAYIYRMLDGGRDWKPVYKVTGEGSGDQFGRSVAMVQDGATNFYTIVVGAAKADGVAEQSGEAYVYRYDGTDPDAPTVTLKKTLTDANGARGDRFGGQRGVGIDRAADGHETILVTAKAHGNYGTSYVFESDDDWAHMSAAPELTASVVWPDNPLQTGDQFGSTSAFLGDTIVIGAEGTSEGYVFEKIAGAWTKTVTLRNEEYGLGGSFAVSDGGDTIVAGPSSFYAPYTYIFERQEAENEVGHTWELAGTLQPFDGTAAYRYGQSVAIASIPDSNKDVIVVADGGDYPQWIYVYTWDGANTEPAFRKFDYDTEGRFAWSGLVTDGRIILVGDAMDDTENLGPQSVRDAGSVYVFEVGLEPATPQAPLANAGPDQTISDAYNNGSVTVTLDGSGSSDVDGTIVSYEWDVDMDGFTDETGVTADHIFAIGTHYVRLTVRDNAGTPATDDVVITVSEPTANETVYVGDLLDTSSAISRSKWNASVTIALIPSNGAFSSLNGAIVDGSWSNGATGPTDCTITDNSGQCTVTKNNVRKSVTSVTFTVEDVTADGFDYDWAANVATSINVHPAEALAVDAVGGPMAGLLLTEALFSPVVEEAVALWGAAGVDAQRLADLSQVDFRIADLGGALLGGATPDSISIDRDAAGYGWSIDPDASQSPHLHGIDLLSAVAHELGHVLGVDHEVMGATLGVGVRDLGYLDDVFRDTNAWTQIRQPGDANGDGRFDQLDLVAVLQAGKYRTGQGADWSQGDWNGDGLSDQLDVVAALRTGNYLPLVEADELFGRLCVVLR